MALRPLTVYLPRAELARLELLARQAGMARSAFAGDAIRRRLNAVANPLALRPETLIFLTAAVEELLSTHPEAEAIRARLTDRFPTQHRTITERE